MAPAQHPAVGAACTAGQAGGGFVLPGALARVGERRLCQWPCRGLTVAEPRPVAFPPAALPGAG